MDVAFVAAQCEQIGQHVTALAAVAGGDEDGLVGGAKAVAGATHALVHWVNGFVLEQEEREEREEVVVLLRDYVERLKDAIVAFVKQKREAFANPMDFLLQQQLDRDRKRVAEAVRHVQQVVASIAGADGSAADSVMSVYAYHPPHTHSALTHLARRPRTLQPLLSTRSPASRLYAPSLLDRATRVLSDPPSRRSSTRSAAWRASLSVTASSRPTLTP